MACSWDRVALGSTGLQTSPLGIASSYGLGGTDVERAFDRGVNYIYWGSFRNNDFGKGISRIAKRSRSDLIVVIQSYTRVASLMKPSLDLALWRLGLDYADILLLGWWNGTPPSRILDAARRLKEQGRARHIMVSGHDRLAFAKHIATPINDAIMVRYNAAHTGAEQDVFPHLASRRVGVVSYTATRWGDLLNPKKVPSGEQVPSSTDCYRFALTNPHVDVCLTGPRNGKELDEAMAALDRGPLDDNEMAWMRRVGKAVRARWSPMAGSS